jgi:hypothetical protein
MNVERTLQELDRKRSEIEATQKELERQRAEIAKATNPVQRNTGVIVLSLLGFLMLMIGISFTVLLNMNKRRSKPQ